MASLMRRLGSMRRTSNTQVRSPGADSEHGDKAGKYMKCNVAMLDDSYKTFDVEKNSQGSELLNDVFDFMDIIEQDYFGLTFEDDNGKQKWLNPMKTVKKQLKSHFSDHSYLLELRVKFYVSSPAKLQEEFTRYQFYLQIKRDIFQNRLPCSFEEAAILSSYILQSELGDYNPEEHPEGYTSGYRFVPNQTEELEDRIAELHKEHIGLTPADAEYNFLMKAKDLDYYGIELFQAQDPHGLELMVGITHIGVVVFHHKRKVNTFEWAKIHQVTYKRRRFTMHITPEQSTQNYVSFILDSSEICKDIWKTCIEHHTFFKLHKPPEPQKRTFFKRGSKFTYSGRTEKQAMQDYREKVRERRIENITFERASSERYKKRTKPFQRPDSDPVSAAVKRAHTIKDTRTTGKPTLEPRRLSWQDFSSFGHDATANGEAVSSHNSVIKQDQDANHATTDYFDMVPSTGPTEYYDERNAQDETVANFSMSITKRCSGILEDSVSKANYDTKTVLTKEMDDLASEGLLLTRIEGDELGRFGFNIRGGVDQEMPIMVSRVVPDGAAAKANPPLHEGDQILYINGHSMSDQSHEHAVMLIKASKELKPCELIMVIKPQDLSRVNPITFNQSATHSDNPEENVKASLLHLRESLRDGTALLQFDQLYRRKPGMAALACKQPHNIAKNRYRDISAYDATRVKLLEGPDYINANYVNMELVKTQEVNRYIAAQGPMQHTCRDFWQMVWEQESTFIIMLTLITEGGKVKCCKYWPDLKSTMAFGPYEVRCVSEQLDPTYITRYFTLRNIKMKQERRILHLQYISWPDHGVPDKAVEFLNFVQHVRLEREGMEEPTIVHCSAGIGRTGVLMAMEMALCMLESMEPINPLDIVRVMRNQRGMLVQTPAQYKFVCESILRAYEEGYVDDIHNHNPITNHS